jgi:hypothetical protein
MPIECSVTCMHTVSLVVRCFYEIKNYEDKYKEEINVMINN